MRLWAFHSWNAVGDFAEIHSLRAVFNPSHRKAHHESNGRTTKQLADDYLVKPETVLRRYSTTGSYFGLLPTKLPNGRLLWPPKREASV